MIKHVVVLTSLLLAFSTAQADKTIGQTFPIAEPDTRDEIKAKAGMADWQAWMKPGVENASAYYAAKLPFAQEDDSRLFDPTYHLPRDMKDKDGRILYPAGYPINIYNRIRMPGRYIVIAHRPSHYDWLDDVAKPTANDKVLLAGAHVLAARKATERELWRLDDRMIERFGLQAVPAIVSQEGTQLRVQEYAVD